MRLFVSAAEASSDAHAARLIAALKAQHPNEKFEIYGIGGDRLKEQGLEQVVDSRELLSMGLGEVIVRLPRILRALKKITKHLESRQPDLALLVDYPEFHFKLAKRLRGLGIPAVYYIPPKVWVWRKGRIKFLQKYFLKVLCIFPFEEKLYLENGLNARYVGNPLLDELPMGLSRAEARDLLDIGDAEKVFTVMPGSRPGEIAAHWDLMLQAINRSAKILHDTGKITVGKKPLVLLPLAATIDPPSSDFKKFDSIEVRIRRTLHAECLAAADFGLIKSGTSALEAALMNCPHLIVYRPSPTTTFAFKNIVRYRGPVGLPNIILNEETPRTSVFKELLMEDANVGTITKEFVTMVTDASRAPTMAEATKEIKRRLDVGTSSPSEVAANEIYAFLSNRETLGQIVPKPRGFNVLAWAASSVWSVVNGFVRVLKALKIVRPVDLGTRVISVGNIQAGGTGKTPIVAKIAEEGVNRGLNVAILTRGYKSAWEKEGGLIFPDSECPSVDLCGDEAALLHERVPKAWIGIGEDRVKSYQEICRSSERPVDLVVLDDGFQNWKIKKDLDVVAVTDRSPGEAIFRDFKGSLKHADLVIWTKGDEPEGIKLDVRILMKISAEQEERPVWVVSGIGDGLFLEESLKSTGIEIEKHFRFSDHRKYKSEEVEGLIGQAKGRNRKLVLTGKDWVKWRELIKPEEQESVVVVEPEVEFLAGYEVWEEKLWGSSPSRS